MSLDTFLIFLIKNSIDLSNPEKLCQMSCTIVLAHSYAHVCTFPVLCAPHVRYIPPYITRLTTGNLQWWLGSICGHYVAEHLGYFHIYLFCKSPWRFLTLSLPTSPISDVIADCQRRRSATWTPSPNLVKSLCLHTLCNVQSILDFDTWNLGYLLNVIERKGRKNKILENLLACLSTIPLAVKINVALRKQNCQKIGSERVNVSLSQYVPYNGKTSHSQGSLRYPWCERYTKPIKLVHSIRNFFSNRFTTYTLWLS